MIKRTAKQLLILFFSVFAIFWIQYDLNIRESSWSNTKMFLAFLIVTILIIIFMPSHRINDWNRLIILAGMFMRIWYVLWTNYMERGHDFYSIDMSLHGHGGYINWIYSKGCLPDTNLGQYYHPPLYHALCAGILRFFSIFHHGDDLITMYQITRVISCFAACAALLMIYKICSALNLSERVKLMVILGTSFFPGYFIMAGFVNNDALAYFFMSCIILTVIKWYKNHNMRNAICMALSFGLGVMTKLNVAVLALPVAVLMIYKIYIGIKQKNYKALLKEYAVFLIISLPIGLWYSIRNLIRFNQPFNYVLDLSDGNAVSLRKMSMIKRLLPVEWKNFFSPLYIKVSDEFNMFKYIAKTSMFGEYEFNFPKAAVVVLIILNIVLIIVSVAALVYMMFVNFKKSGTNALEDNRRPVLIAGAVVLFVIWLVSYMLFNIRYPFACTMDFRYIALMPVIGFAGIGMMEEYL